MNSTVFATYPIYGSILAVVFLGEMLKLENWVGILCCVVGVVLIQKSSISSEIRHRRNPTKGLIFSLLAALLVALSSIFRKHALNISNGPLIGAAIGYSSALLFFFLMLICTDNTLRVKISGKDFRLFWKAGLSSCLALILSFYALSYDRVSIVTPLVQTEPMFVLFFVNLYLKEVEQISHRLILSTLLIVLGVILIGVG